MTASEVSNLREVFMQNDVTTDTSTPSIERHAAKGVFVRYDPGLPGYERCALLLATIACPPRRADDLPWRQVVRAFCRLHMAEGEEICPEFFASPQTGPITPGHLSFDLQLARKLVEKARATLNARLVASHIMMPFLWEGLGKAGKAEFRGFVAKTTLTGRITEVVRREADRLDALVQRYGERPANRFAMGRNEFHEKNFLTKVLLPARTALHVVAALDHVMELTARELRRSASPQLREMLAMGRRPTAGSWSACPSLPMRS